jgi:hypothetical protein
MATEDITQEAFTHLNKMLKKKEAPAKSTTQEIQPVPPSAIAGFMDSNGVFHPLQPNTSSQSNTTPSSSNTTPSSFRSEPPLNVEDKLNCPCLNCKLFGSHNPTPKERQAVLITYAQMVAAAIFIAGIVIIFVKLYIL